MYDSNSARIEMTFPARLARVFLIVAGMLMLSESLLGLDYALDIGFGSLRALLNDFCLTMGFPIYLVGLFSLRGASASLGAFLILQWLNHGHVGFHVGIMLANPFDWLHGLFSFLSAILVSASTWILCHPQDGIAHVNMRTVFE
jgi:hypothetical protein